MTAVDLCAFDELAPDSAQRFVVDRLAVCVVRLGDDVYAIGDRCTHQDISLSEGDLDADECTIECWKHGSQFDLRTGKPLSLPATKATPVFDVRVVDGRVLVEVEQ